MLTCQLCSWMSLSKGGLLLQCSSAQPGEATSRSSAGENSGAINHTGLWKSWKNYPLLLNFSNFFWFTKRPGSASFLCLKGSNQLLVQPKSRLLARHNLQWINVETLFSLSQDTACHQHRNSYLSSLFLKYSVLQ